MTKERKYGIGGLFIGSVGNTLLNTAKQLDEINKTHC